jgi:hypothetical protein
MPIIELNNRPNLILKSFADLNAQRIVLIALPFLAFNRSRKSMQSYAASHNTSGQQQF